MPLFGFPTSGSSADAATAATYLRAAWRTSYGTEPSEDLAADLRKCDRFFDPLTRGQTLRERLAALGEVPPPPNLQESRLEAPIVITVDATHHLVGVEARLLLDALTPWVGPERLTRYELPDADVERYLAQALTQYRTWATRRFKQVVDLQSGHGTEALQAKSVGLALALLVNRSTTRERAIVPDERAEDATGAERAVFAGAEAFATLLADRNGRSNSQDRLKGGYATTEARRRLSDLRIEPVGDPGAAGYFIRAGGEGRVLQILAGELARRPRVTVDSIAIAFDALVAAFRRTARQEAWRGGIHERPATTAAIRTDLLTEFQVRRDQPRVDA